MSNIVYESILSKNNISESNLMDLISNLYVKNFNYGDLFFQNSVLESFFLENKIIKNSFINFKNGVGVRIISDNKISFSCSDKINFRSILNLINKIKSIHIDKKINKCINLLFNSKKKSIYKKKSLINFSLNKNKIDLLLYLDNYIRKSNPYINYVSINLINSYDLVLIVSTDNVFVGDIRPLTNLSIKIQLEKNNYQEIGIGGGGGSYFYDDLINKYYENIPIVEHWANETIRIGINNLYAVNSPSGNFPIVLGSGCPGVLLHEAVGHGLEGDFIRKKISIYTNLIGKKVASNLCTVVDDGSINGLKGFLNVDDEGISGKKNILIKNGILKSFMLDKFNANLMKLKSTGNARRESYAYLPIPRMTNTYLVKGKNNFSDLINSVDFGIYIVNLSSGQVDITSGKFVFTVLEGYLIKKGKISSPIKGCTLIGSVIEIMNKISMISDDFKFDNGSGICGKDNQNIPVSVGQPSLKIDSMIIGGTN